MVYFLYVGVTALLKLLLVRTGQTAEHDDKLAKKKIKKKKIKRKIFETDCSCSKCTSTS